MSGVTISAISDPGRKRKENQDSHVFHVPRGGASHKKGILLALADGMGGHSGGSVASRITIESLMEAYYDEHTAGITEALEKAFHKANANVIEKGESDLALHGMGSTLVVVVLKDDKMYYAHVGDSRGYSIFDQQITQLTEDHSYVASLVKAGVISEEQAANHPESNIITRAIGANPELQVDLCAEPLQLHEGQYILLCCDGLYRVVSNEEIKNTIYEYRHPDDITKKLIEMANAGGGPDNITVLIARIDSVGSKPNLLNRILDFLR